MGRMAKLDFDFWLISRLILVIMKLTTTNQIKSDQITHIRILGFVKKLNEFIVRSSVCRRLKCNFVSLLLEIVSVENFQVAGSGKCDCSRPYGNSPVGWLGDSAPPADTLLGPSGRWPVDSEQKRAAEQVALKNRSDPRAPPKVEHLQGNAINLHND